MGGLRDAWSVVSACENVLSGGCTVRMCKPQLKSGLRQVTNDPGGSTKQNTNEVCPIMMPYQWLMVINGLAPFPLTHLPSHLDVHHRVGVLLDRVDTHPPSLSPGCAPPRWGSSRPHRRVSADRIAPRPSWRTSPGGRDLRDKRQSEGKSMMRSKGPMSAQNLDD